MWRCINRLDYGKKYCLNSITVQENDLHAAIVRALKRFNAENESTYLTLMKATIGDAIGINGGSDEIDLLTRRVETLNKRMITLVNETIQSGGDMESNEDEFKDISEQIEQLMLSYLIGGNDAAPLKTDARLELSTHKGNINNRLEQC